MKIPEFHIEAGYRHKNLVLDYGGGEYDRIAITNRHDAAPLMEICKWYTEKVMRRLGYEHLGPFEWRRVAESPDTIASMRLIANEQYSVARGEYYAIILQRGHEIVRVAEINTAAQYLFDRLLDTITRIIEAHHYRYDHKAYYKVM